MNIEHFPKQKNCKNNTLVPSYVLVTPARNEAAFIEQTIQSVIHQKILPVRWIIVSDGSNDGTDEIVERYALRFPWIGLVKMPPRAERDFGGKARAFKAAYEKLNKMHYDIIANLDADITFDEDYFYYLLKKFVEYPNLGVAGAPFRQGNFQYNYQFSRKEHVSGACQLFRRECYESIGGYVPIKEGGIDLAAVVTARMKGWKTETFSEKYCIHNRSMGKAGSHLIKYFFMSGVGDYRMGVHPLWQFFRSIYQMSHSPIFLSGFLHLAGYFWAMIIRAPKPVSRDFVHFRKKEQMGWLKEYYKKALALLE